MDRFDALQAFARVVETGSFTKAAGALHMSKTTVTQLVQQLEARLRVKLLNRTTRRVGLTPDGAAYHERVLRVLVELEDADTSLSGANAVPRGRLRIDVPAPLASLVLVPALPDFHHRYPDIQLNLGVSDRAADLIGDSVDCAVRGGEVTDPSLVARRVGELAMGVFAAPGYLAQAGTPAHPADLAEPQHRIIGYRSPRSGRLVPIVLRRGDEQVTVQARHATSVDDGNAYLAAGLAGLGVVSMPRYMGAPHAASGALQPLFTQWEIEPMPLSIVYSPNRHVSAKLRAFMDWLARLLADRAHMDSGWASPPILSSRGNDAASPPAPPPMRTGRAPAR